MFFKGTFKGKKKKKMPVRCLLQSDRENKMCHQNLVNWAASFAVLNLFNYSDCIFAEVEFKTLENEWVRLRAHGDLHIIPKRVDLDFVGEKWYNS